MPARRFGTASSVYHRPEWRRTRALVVARAGNRCERCGKSEPRLSAHHKVSLRDGGSNDPANLVLVCRSCHSLAHKEGEGEWRDGPARVVLVTGPPGVDLLGKVRELLRDPGRDVVIDALLVAQGMFEGVSDFATLAEADRLEVSAKRAELIHDIRRGKVPRRAARVFITSSNPNPSFLPHHGEPLIVDPGISAMLNKVETGELPPIYDSLIRRYYADREQAEADYQRSQRKEAS